MGAQLMAIVVGGDRKRTYVSPSAEDVVVAQSAPSTWRPDAALPENPRDFKTPNYGLQTFADLFTPRQLFLLATFTELVSEARAQVVADGASDGYADAVTTFLGLSASKLVVFHNSLARWRPGEGKSAPAFGRQAVPMVWDYAEVNPFAGAGGDWEGVIAGSASVLERLPGGLGVARELDATAAVETGSPSLVCTDPPYYDNIGYADLSDFFYIWLRPSLRSVYPDLFSTLLTPKTQELVATPYRFGGDRRQAERFFEEGLRESFRRMRAVLDARFPLVLFYAFKQVEVDGDGPAAMVSTGWETMLTGLLEAGFSVTGTWPSRTEGATRMIAMNRNALASSIVLVCRPKPDDAPITDRRDFIRALRAELPVALRQLQHGNVAPVDLAQAAIGPGMATFSRFGKVVEADGSPMTVRTALGLINQSVDEILAEQEGDFDSDTRFAVAWFEQYGTSDGPYGEADVLARAKDVGINGLKDAGILISRAGKVRLLNRDELSTSWDPAFDGRLTVWEVAQHLVKRLDEGGEPAAADLLGRVGGLGETARELAYRLYTICERKSRPQEALGYNALVVSWPEIVRLAGENGGPTQQTLGV